jgi:hypothetical protein
MSGLDAEQLDELEYRVSELLEEPWDTRGQLRAAGTMKLAGPGRSLSGSKAGCYAFATERPTPVLRAAPTLEV